MEAVKMGFGFKTLTQYSYRNTPVTTKTNFSLFCRPSVYLKPMKHDLLSVKATTKITSTDDDDLESTRPLIQFAPTFWGDHFLSVTVDESEVDEIAREIETVMKPNVRDKLMSSHNNSKDKIRLIHLLISLGIFHYFETEIEMILNQAFEDLVGFIAEEDDLETISIMFEVFRLYQHNMSCDMFKRFKAKDGTFKESLVKDVRGMLQLYQAAHLRTPSEDIMEEALSFTRNQLESLMLKEISTLPPHLSMYIRNALYRPRYHNMEIFVAKEYISFYQQEYGHDETLLMFAKLNFNYCRLLYIKELKTLTKWWNELDVATKLPYVRDRIVEAYFPTLGLHFEPQYSLGRIIATKLTMILIVLDDTCDAYGTLPEVKSLVEFLQRWELGGIEELSTYLRIVVRILMENMEDLDKEMKLRGRSYSVQRTIDEIKTVGRAYLAISKWARSGHVPSFEEYIKVGVVTAGMEDFVLYSIIAMEDIAEKPFFEWYDSNPKIFKALCTIYRLNNDIVTYEQEIRRGEVANGVNCYMKQHCVTKEEAVEELSKMARENYKITIEEFLKTIDVPRQVLLRCLNIARMIDVFCKDGIDEFTHSHGKLKDLITSFFVPV